MENMYMYLIIAGAFVLGIALMKIIPMLKDKKIDSTESVKIQEIIVSLIKDGLAMSTISTKDELVTFVSDRVFFELKANGITSFTEAEVKNMVVLGVNLLGDKLK